jgi:hypothetical protein
MTFTKVSSMMMQTGLFDWQIRFEQLDHGGDPLPDQGL